MYTIPLRGTQNTHLRQPRQVHQRQIQHIRAVDPQRDRELAHALILAGHAECLLFDLLPDLAIVCEALVYMQELRPLVGLVARRGFRRGGSVDELEDERAAGDDALATW